MITAKIQPIDRDLKVAMDAWLGPAARASMLADEARIILAEADATNAAAVGQPLQQTTYVDGRKDGDLASVRPDGVIVRTYDALPVLLAEIWNMLWKHSPVLSGDYQRSHILLADGEQIAAIPGDGQSGGVIEIPKGARELVFVPTEPYARKIDNIKAKKPFSSKAPDGVYHVVAELAKPIIGGFGKVSFGYREVAEMDESIVERRTRPGAPRDMRQPALIIMLR